MSAVNDIVVWLKDKPIWWQYAVHRSLEDDELTSESKDDIYQVALMEHGLLDVDGKYEKAKMPIDTTGYEEEVAEVTLESISNVINVGALAEDQVLKFPRNGLSVIYGDNGAGKSCYSRILKHACLTRGHSPQILGNVFNPSAEPSSAVISIDIDGCPDDKDWNLDYTGDSSLKAIRIFDDAAASHFVSGEDELGYKPSGLDILEDLVTAIDYVKQQVSDEIASDVGVVELPEFGDTDTGQFVAKLSHKTSMTDLERFIVTDDEIQSVDGLTKEIADLKAKSPEQIRKELNTKKLQLVSLQTFITGVLNSLSDQVFEDVKNKFLDLKHKLKLAQELRDRLLSGMTIANVGGKEWHMMWNAAEEFLKSNEGISPFPPQKDDNCPLCLQEISEDSAIKLAGFSEFLADQTSLQAQEAQELFDVTQKTVSDCDLNVAPYEASIAIMEDIYTGFRQSFGALIIALGERKTFLTGDIIPETIEALPVDVVEQLKSEIIQIDVSLAEISDDDNVTDVLHRKERNLAEIADKKIFTTNIDHIKSNLLRLRSLMKFKSLKSQCKTKSVTDLNSDICKDGVIRPLIDSFDSELRKFGFDRFNVRPKTRGRSGAQLLKLEIVDCGEPLVGKIASEGEQRCIAIACFLAEVSADKRKSAVIFDDPVNSLSHRWSASVAKRLVEESLSRQVVVLTHDIVFYKLLSEEVEKSGGATMNEICLERSRKKAGLVRSTPPWDALTTSKRIKQLRVMFRDLKSIDENGTEAEFRKAAYEFYSYLREAWERLVEEKLLNQVVTRFGRAIQTNRLKRIIDITEADLEKIEVNMGKCSTYFRGHDSAPAVGDAYPTIDEIALDLKCIDEYNKELQENRKRN